MQPTPAQSDTLVWFSQFYLFEYLRPDRLCSQLGQFPIGGNCVASNSPDGVHKKWTNGIYTLVFFGSIKADRYRP